MCVCVTVCGNLCHLCHVCVGVGRGGGGGGGAWRVKEVGLEGRESEEEMGCEGNGRVGLEEGLEEGNGCEGKVEWGWRKGRV